MVLYPRRKGQSVFSAIRFIWNATRGHRLRPWRSEYLRWRVETYSGMKADTLTARSVLRFLWETRAELVSFLLWTGRMEREARKRV
jgi:hypothetical protein